MTHEPSVCQECGEHTQYDPVEVVTVENGHEYYRLVPAMVCTDCGLDWLLEETNESNHND